MKKNKLPLPTVNRISVYLKIFKELQEEGINYVTSKNLSQISGIHSDRIRKDFSFVGKLGKRKVGYDINFINSFFSKILGNLKVWNVGIIGIGNLGRALMCYNEFKEKKFNICAGFDIDFNKIGWEINGIMIYSLDDIKKVIKKKKIDILILTVPQKAVEYVLNKIKNLRIKGIMNFANKYIPNNRHNFVIKNIDITIEMEQLIYQILIKESKRGINNAKSCGTYNK